MYVHTYNSFHYAPYNPFRNIRNILIKWIAMQKNFQRKVERLYLPIILAPFCHKYVLLKQFRLTHLDLIFRATVTILW